MADEPVAVFDPTLKKKKKKKPAAFEPEEAAADAAPEPAKTGAETGEPTVGDFQQQFGKKKKPKKPKKVEFDDELEFQATPDDQTAENDAADSPATDIDLPWTGTDRDYKYEELLGRVFGILTEHHPELSGEKRKHIIRPPQVAREGSKKTVFINFIDICRTMHRHQDHLYAYLLAELGTSGSIDGNYRLVLKGRFQPKGIENVLRRYIQEYVSCHSCKSPDTTLNKENRLYFLHCNSCGASRSVAPIKTGFQAQIGKRRAEKEKKAA